MKRYKRIVIFTLCFVLLYCFGFTGGYLYIKSIQKAEGKQVEVCESKATSELEEQNKQNTENKSNDKDELIKKINTNKVNGNKVQNTKKGKNKVVYLTFDDGPSNDVTPEILRILADNDIKATFFVIGVWAEENKDLVKKEVKLGHAVGNHTYSHNLNLLYRDMDFFKDDVEKGARVIKSILGEDYNCDLFRFPGGSFENWKEPFKKYIKEKGDKYYDWNCLNGDAEGNGFTKERLFSRFKETFGGGDKIIILMHDTSAKKSTPEALPLIIEYLKESGYSFDTLENY